MKILVVGSGGREHALCWAISASPLCDELYCAPGNAGIAQVADCIDIAAMDLGALLKFCRAKQIDFVVVGPEDPLCAGLVDQLNEAGIKAFGPSAAAAQLEGSKRFTKELCDEARIPTAQYRSFSDLDPALDYVQAHPLPLVVKADGLAAGKGVTIATTLEAAQSAIRDVFDGRFGAAELVIEEFLVGEEASFFALVDGTHILPLASAQDHKRVGDGDTGPNTGGMGAYSPAPIMTPEMTDRVMTEIISPTVEALKGRGTPYKGVLYAGLMITEQGPKLIEYNVRFGDPECQVLMMRLMSDILPVLIATADGVLDHVDLRWYDKAALTVVMATSGYPGSYDKGSEIKGLASAGDADDTEIFHAGTKSDGDKILANGGRVLNVTALGDTVAAAQKKAYAAIEMIDWPEGFCRKDIGWRAV